MEDNNNYLTLTQASKTRYYKKEIYVSAIITGKALLPYQVPEKFDLQCVYKRHCKECAFYDIKNISKVPIVSFKLDKNDTNLLRFINVPDINFNSIFRAMYNLPTQCLAKYQIKSIYSIEEIYMQERINNIMQNTTRVGYLINERAECNTPYKLKLIPMPEPRTQKIIYLIVEASKLKIDIDRFKITEKTKIDLTIFNLPENNAKIKNEVEFAFEFLQNLYDIYAHNLTKIYKRFDLHLAIDLVFHSPLQFTFNNEFVHKGWLDILIMGDTRCGKGYVSENLVKYYGQGEIVSGENVSFAGLVGGVQQIASRWIITWGKIPLNNKKLVVIDESGEMDAKNFSRLSRIRSEGIAEITKIQTEKTMAQTRLIFLTNPKNRLISSYSFGIEAIPDLIENPEDISRFDYALVVSQSEVDLHEMNKHIEPKDNPYELFDPILIQWIWSRKKDQIIFKKEATELILDYAIKLGEIYSPKIPLIQGENIRIKLAKISAAIAGRLFSCDITGNKLIIKPIHVHMAHIFINLIYKKPTSGYYDFSQIQRQTYEIHDIKSFEKYIYSFENKNDLVGYFTENNYITLTDLSECMDQPKEIARSIISKLLHFKCIQKKYTFYVKSQSFTNWLKRHL